MDSLNIIVWNIRGASNKLARVNCKELVRKFKPVIFIVVEIHCPFQHLKLFWERLGYHPIGIVEASRHKGVFGSFLQYRVFTANWLMLSISVLQLRFR